MEILTPKVELLFNLIIALYIGLNLCNHIPKDLIPAYRCLNT